MKKERSRDRKRSGKDRRTRCRDRRRSRRGATGQSPRTAKGTTPPGHRRSGTWGSARLPGAPGVAYQAPCAVATSASSRGAEGTLSLAMAGGGRERVQRTRLAPRAAEEAEATTERATDRRRRRTARRRSSDRQRRPVEGLQGLVDPVEVLAPVRAEEGVGHTKLEDGELGARLEVEGFPDYSGEELEELGGLARRVAVKASEAYARGSLASVRSCGTAPPGEGRRGQARPPAWVPHPGDSPKDSGLPVPPEVQECGPVQGGAMWIHIGRCLRIFSRVSTKTSSFVRSQDSRAPCLSRGSHTWCPVPESAFRTASVTPPFPAKSSQKAGPFPPASPVSARGGAGLPTPGSCGASWPRQFSALRSPGQDLSGCLPRHF